MKTNTHRQKQNSYKTVKFSFLPVCWFQVSSFNFLVLISSFMPWITNEWVMKYMKCSNVDIGEEKRITSINMMYLLVAIVCLHKGVTAIFCNMDGKNRFWLGYKMYVPGWKRGTYSLMHLQQGNASEWKQEIYIFNKFSDKQIRSWRCIMQ